MAAVVSKGCLETKAETTGECQNERVITRPPLRMVDAQLGFVRGHPYSLAEEGQMAEVREHALGRIAATMGEG